MSEPKNLYLLMAREVSADSRTGMTSIHDIIEKFTSKVDKASVHEQGLKPGEATILLQIPYYAATSWVLGKKLTADTFYNIRLEVIDPSGKSLGGPEQEHLIPKGAAKLNLNFNHQGLPATTSGTYLLRTQLLNKDKKLLAEAEYPFEIVLDWQ